MATHPFFGTLNPIVQEWAIVQWVDTATKESRHMGQLGPRQGATGADFSLCVGLKGHELLVAFHLPVPLRPVPTKAPKPMYVVLPVESLVMGVFYATISSADIPAMLREELQKSDLQAGTTFLHVNIRLDQPPGVLMHLPQPIKKPITGVPLELLSSLKSLSESRIFNLCLQEDKAISEQLFRICDIIHGRSYNTPANQLVSKWAKDKWDAFPTQNGTLATPLCLPPLCNENPPVSVPACQAPPEQALERRNIGFQPQEPPQTAASPAETVTCYASTEMTATSVCFTDELDMDEPLSTQAMRLEAIRALLATLLNETSTPGSSLNEVQTDLVVDLAEWLYHAWAFDPVAHWTFCADLGKLAVAARTCNHRVFDILRIRCQQRLMLDNPVEKSARHVNLPSTLKDKIKDLIDYVYTNVARNADILIRDEVIQLRCASLRVEAARADGDLDNGMTEDEFGCRLALCVVMAFFKTWGSAELRTV
ncbi:Uridylate kinase [Lasiodiplodia theobromae]|uniref:Uridylate kinase n=1 Tax=Lasiodiplodia theobromae TaxID=45133 RepID=UPI0015C2D438|nr:Uridylate kinase [Lasiodiplodia theobromae]KAF4537820.1 Uridylate kinase [Lasiodiplodia theobromae]